jgi:CRP/FNR family transcriptional regulator, cyclic AMP receptor protein
VAGFGVASRVVEGPVVDVKRAAAAHDFEAALEPADLDAFLKEARLVRYESGRALCHEGQVPTTVMLLRNGHVKVTRVTPGGREVVLAFRGPGELVGEQSALDDEPRSATVVALNKVEVSVLTHAAFRAFLAERPAVSLALLRMLSLRLREGDAQRVEFAAFNTLSRVTIRLLELSERFGQADDGVVRIDLPLTQEVLAGFTGSSLESVGRALQTLRTLKCVQTRRREIRVDRVALEARLTQLT